jgi:hypothetical protein
MGEQQIDHMSLSVWRFGDSWMYSMSARDESGEQLVVSSGACPGTRRPLDEVDYGTAVRLILYAIATV